MIEEEMRARVQASAARARVIRRTPMRDDDAVAIFVPCLFELSCFPQPDIEWISLLLHAFFVFVFTLPLYRDIYLLSFRREVFLSSF